jgi:hypothetical protein
VLQVSVNQGFTKEVMRTAAGSKARPGHHGGPSGPRATNPGSSTASIQNWRNCIYMESTTPKNTQMLPRSLYRWSFVLLPILALVLSACGTGGSTGGVGY